MGKQSNLNLIGIPWPTSLLLCNRQVEEMKFGDRLLVELKDPDLKNNLSMIFDALPQVVFKVRDEYGVYCMVIEKHR